MWDLFLSKESPQRLSSASPSPWRRRATFQGAFQWEEGHLLEAMDRK